MLLERYMAVARQVSRLAVGDTTMMVAPVTYNIDSSLRQTDRASEDLPFGARGITVQHTFPLDGEYVVQVRLKRTQNEYIRGLGRKPQPMELRVDGERVKVFAEAGLMKGIPPVEGYTQSDLGSADWEKNSLDGDDSLQVRFDAKAGTRLLALSLPGRRWVPDEDFVLPPRAGREENRDGNIDIKTVEISGPFNVKKPEDSASRRKIFSCYPASEAEQERCASTILATLAKRAYRRPVSDKDVQTLMQFCRSGLARGFDACIQTAPRAHPRQPVFPLPRRGPAGRLGSSRPPARPSRARAFSMATPRDLDVLAATPSAEPTPISDLDLASRLSFFLWSSIPDDQLLDLAAQHKLRDPGGARQAGAADAGRPAVAGARRQLRRSVARPSQAGSGVARRARFPGFRRRASHVDARRDRALHRQHAARRSADSRARCPRTTRSSTSGWPGTT